MTAQGIPLNQNVFATGATKSEVPAASTRDPDPAASKFDRLFQHARGFQDPPARLPPTVSSIRNAGRNPPFAAASAPPAYESAELDNNPASDARHCNDSSSRARNSQQEEDEACADDRDREEKRRLRSAQDKAQAVLQQDTASQQAAAAASALANRAATDHPNSQAPPGTEPSGSPPTIVPVETESVQTARQTGDENGELMDPRAAQSSGPGVSTPNPTGSQTNSVSLSPESSFSAQTSVSDRTDAGTTSPPATGSNRPNAPTRDNRLSAIERIRVVRDSSPGTPESDGSKTVADGVSAATQGLYGAPVTAQTTVVIERGLGALPPGSAASAEIALQSTTRVSEQDGKFGPAEGLLKPGGTAETATSVLSGAVSSIDTLAHVIGVRGITPRRTAGAGTGDDSGSSTIEGTTATNSMVGIVDGAIVRGGGSGAGTGDSDNRDSTGERGDEDGEPGPLPTNSAASASLQPFARHLPAAAALPLSAAADQASVVDRTQLVQQVARHIETMRAAARSGEMTLKLNPEHLGSMQLTIVSHGNGVSARIAVETAAAYRACDEAKDQLRTALENRGLDVTSIDISLNQQQSGDTAFSRQQQAAPQPPGYNIPRSTVREPEIIAAVPIAPPSARQRNGSGGLDYRA